MVKIAANIALVTLFAVMAIGVIGERDGYKQRSLTIALAVIAFLLVAINVLF